MIKVCSFSFLSLEWNSRFMPNKLYNCIFNKSLYFLAIFYNLHKDVFKAVLTFDFLHSAIRN